MCYLTIRGKTAFDFYLPILSAVLFVCFDWFLQSNVGVCFILKGVNGILRGLSGMMISFSGLCFAGLVYIVSSERKGLDDVYSEEVTVFNLRRDVGSFGKSPALTRRRYLSYMFGYLTMISVLVSMLSYFLSFLPVGFSAGVRYFGLFFYVFFISQMLFIVIFSLYFLVDRVHYVETKKLRN